MKVLKSFLPRGFEVRKSTKSGRYFRNNSVSEGIALGKARIAPPPHTTSDSGRKRQGSANPLCLPLPIHPIEFVHVLGYRRCIVRQEKKSTKINFLGPETARWGGHLPPFGCPGNFAGMSRTPGGGQTVRAKEVCAPFSAPIVKGGICIKLSEIDFLQDFHSPLQNLRTPEGVSEGVSEGFLKGPHTCLSRRTPHCRDVPDPWGCSKSLCKKKCVRIFRSLIF